MPRVRDEKHQAVEARVPLLQDDASLHGLEVGEMCLRLDSDDVALERCPGVDCPQIPGDRKRDLRLPRRTTRQTSLKPSEQPEMGCVPYRVARWVRPKGWSEADGRAGQRDFPHRKTIDLSTFDPPEC